MSDSPESPDSEMPEESRAAKLARGALQVAGGVPGVGGVFSAIAGAWSEREQAKVNQFFQQWLQVKGSGL